MIEHEIDSINDHLPKKRVPLHELLEMEEPSYETRDGKISVFKKEELTQLAADIPEKHHKDITLPIVILRRMDLGTGIHTIAGTKHELFIIHRTIQKVIGQVDLEWEEFPKWRPLERLARPEVQVLRRKLPSTTCIGITMVQDRKST
jgi:uncharacterized protein (UPF0216 family)